MLAFASEDSVLEPLSVAELLPVWEPLPAAELLWEDEVLSLEETLLLVLWEELDSPLELDVLPEPDDAPEELVEPALTPLTVTFRVLLVTVQPL